MEKKLRLSAKGSVRLVAVFAVILWLWNFFRSYLLFLMMLLLITGVIISAAVMMSARDSIQVTVVLPYHRVGKKTDIPCDIRFLNLRRFVGFSIDATYRYGNLFTGDMEEKKEKLWAAPREGGTLSFLLNSRYAGRLKVSVETCQIYDPLHLFCLTCREAGSAEVLAWHVFSDGEDAEELYACIEGFPEEDMSRRRGTEYDPDYEIREYAAGDELKSIHWKLSAKQGKTMVRERLAAGKERINVLLPLGSERDENDALMESVYRLCRALLSKGYPIRLFRQDAEGGLCSYLIMETGELENALGEILSTSGIRAFSFIEEQMAIEHPAERYVLVKTGAYQGAYVIS
ncbi:MAG: DUF58 domain-containing protein [Bacteroidales bacterium]|nr:DUF58 domain-containing protein [Bacteroidales bacterium]MCM1416088.1 DUF58 domain-containing protein [bacterium]MCM1423120.1 DUF58 domain-containing protein [bacterium]